MSNPQNYKTNKELSNWVSTQRTKFKNGTLSQDKIKRLNAIGFVWNYYEVRWEEMFALLYHYKTVRGNCFVSQSDESNKKLAHWVNAQRQKFKKCQLSREKINRLNGIGFIWKIK